MSYIKGLTEGGALPALERLVSFTEARQKVLANNVANISTPYFEPTDLKVDEFQGILQEAIHDRRQTMNPTRGELKMRDSFNFRFHERGMTAVAEETHEGIMFHDRNNRDLERLMQDVAENQLAHQSAVELVRNQFGMLTMAIRERV